MFGERERGARVSPLVRFNFNVEFVGSRLTSILFRLASSLGILYDYSAARFESRGSAAL